jgi:triacylglycerol lipase
MCTFVRRFLSFVFAASVASATLLAASPAQADTYTQTRYPIVLVHGAFGFDAIGPLDYFYAIPSSLRSSGAAVFTPSVSALNTTEARGEQLLKSLLQYKAAYGYTKFNLIGHSHGGTTARYVAAVRPDLVASVTSVATPHLGSKVADTVANITSWTGTTGVAATLSNAVGVFIGALSGDASLKQNALGTLKSLSTAGAATFNTRYPQGQPTSACGSGAGTVNGVRYYSAGGTSVLTNVLDVSDALLGVTGLAFGFEQNDGLVSQCSSRWGTVLRDNYPWNHGDSTNQVFGLRGLFTPDPVSFYRAQANRLKGLGL